MRHCKILFDVFVRFPFYGLLTIVLFSMILNCGTADASEVVLAWNSTNDPRVAGYRLHYGTSISNLEYRITVVKATSCVLSELEKGKTYYFAVAAFGEDGKESELSNMVSKYIESVDVGDSTGPDSYVQALSLSGFVYSDHAFGNNMNEIYAQGALDGGVLKVELGGVDNVDILNGISGGWAGEFIVPQSGSVTIEVTYRLITKFDDDEYAQVLVAIDGALKGVDGEEYVDKIYGTGDSEWRHAALTVNLPKGRHTLRVGGYNNKKTSQLEVAEVFFEKIEVIQ